MAPDDAGASCGLKMEVCEAPDRAGANCALMQVWVGIRVLERRAREDVESTCLNMMTVCNHTWKLWYTVML